MKNFKDVLLVLMFVLGIVLLISGLTGLAYAQVFQTTKPIFCGDFIALDEALKGTNGEIARLKGKTPSGMLYFYVNTETRTFSVVEVIESGPLACMIASGEDFEFVIDGTDA